jgi:hypothetical protein
MPEVPLTRLLMNGACGFMKIGRGDVVAAGCVQLWFSIAITKTVLPCGSRSPLPWSARAVKPPHVNAVAAANPHTDNRYFTDNMFATSDGRSTVRRCCDREGSNRF